MSTKKEEAKTFLYFFDSRKNLLQLSEHVSLVTVLEQPREERERDMKMVRKENLCNPTYSWRKKDANIFCWLLRDNDGVSVFLCRIVFLSIENRREIFR